MASHVLTALLVASAALPWLGLDPYLLQVLSGAHLLVLYVASWDLFCGPTRKSSFGHSAFIGGAAYVSALLAVRGWSPWVAAGTGVAAAGVAGLAVGAIAHRFRGAGFSLLTMALQLALVQVLFLWPELLGGEEGVVGVPRLAGSKGGFALLAVAAGGVVAVRSAVTTGALGQKLAAIGEHELLAQSCGVATTRLQTLVFGLSAALAGLGGVLYAHTRGQVNAELAGSPLAVIIVLLALAGGRGVGPFVVVGVVVAARELLASWPAASLAEVVVLLALVVGRQVFR